MVEMAKNLGTNRYLWDWYGVLQDWWLSAVQMTTDTISHATPHPVLQRYWMVPRKPTPAWPSKPAPNAPNSLSRFSCAATPRIAAIRPNSALHPFFLLKQNHRQPCIVVVLGLAIPSESHFGQATHGNDRNRHSWKPPTSANSPAQHQPHSEAQCNPLSRFRPSHRFDTGQPEAWRSSFAGQQSCLPLVPAPDFWLLC